jgi:regulatory protein
MDKKQAKPRKAPRRISKTYLENAALYYLQRYASSAANLKSVLKRKVERSCKFHDTEAAPFMPVIDDIIARYLKSGLLDDAAYARAKTASLRRQGKSRQAIHAKLASRGVPRERVAEALSNVDENEDSELAAAITLAKRKKIGVFRKEEADLKQRQKELAAMGRAGFSYETARAALQCEEEE